MRIAEPDIVTSGLHRARLGWYCYDWASSVLTAVLTSVAARWSREALSDA
jgi:hypothetical protein